MAGGGGGGGRLARGRRGGGAGGGGASPERWRNDGFDNRHVSFKPGAFKKGNKFKKNNWNKNAALRDAILDDDIDMCSSNLAQRVNISGRGNFRGGSRGRINTQAPRQFPQKRFQPGPLPWYQVVIPFGEKHGKDFVLKSILNYIEPIIFYPYCFKVNGNAFVFYVDDVKTAEKLFYADRKIKYPDGYNMAIRVQNSTPPLKMDDQMREKMKLVMGKRYEALTKALDMTKFHADNDLRDVFCALFRPVIMLAAIEIMEEFIPDVEALNLNDNKLHAIDHLRSLTKFKSLKILYLGDNRIPYIGALEALRGLPLVELVLKGNPLVSKFSDHDIYVSDVRKIFPKLLKLDGQDLPPQIGFDVVEDVVLPPFQQSFLVDPAGQDLIREFLTQYYTIYDSDSRQSLLDAYHENATMSLCANYMFDGKSNNKPSERLNQYMQNSRNLLRYTDRENRRKYLRSGRLHVVSFLSDLPKTQHDLLGFTVDLVVYTPIMMVLTLNGVFKETSANMTPKPHRSFHRTLVIVPNGGGFCIQNDMLFITNASREQERRSFKQAIPAQVTAPAPAPALPAAVDIPKIIDEQEKLTITQAFNQLTGMNHHWCSQCLLQANWDFDRARAIFNQVHAEGKIPPEAFI